MEPLAKRLRRERSLEVDEEHPDYIREKRKAEARLKSQFENIFAKYETMPESMSDEIDMATGRIVVDRGHLRSLENSAQGWRAAQFLDDLLPEDDTPLVYNYDENSEDELAPSDPRKSSAVRECPLSVPELELQAVATTEPHTNDMIQPLTPGELANALRPVEAMQCTQLPQTPSNSHTQNSFLAGLNQVISQAVSQYTSQALSAYLGNHTVSGLATTPVLPPTLQPSAGPTPTSASDDKWWFPTLPERSELPLLPQSSPIHPLAVERKRKAGFTKRRRSENSHHISLRPCMVVGNQSPIDAQESTLQEVNQHDLSTSATDDTGNDILVTPKNDQRGRQRRYHFDDEDDQYIRDQKMMRRTWAEIHAGRPNLKAMPLGTIQHHYYTHLRLAGNKRADPPAEVRTSILKPQSGSSGVEDSPSGTVEQRQLLTPSSLKQLGSRDSNENHDDLELGGRNATLLADEQMDKEDMELLSLASNSPPLQEGEVDDYLVSHDDVIIPSIEGAPLRHVEHSQISTHVATSDAQCLSTHKLRASMARPALDSNSEDLELAPARFSPLPLQLSACKSCEKCFKTSRILRWHQANECARSALPTNNDRSEIENATNAETIDELELPCTPKIKLEPTSPGISLLHTAPLLYTPKSAPQPTLHSSKKKSLKKLDTAERLKIRQSWAKAGRKLAVRPQRSLQLLQYRQSRDRDSDDELAG